MENLKFKLNSYHDFKRSRMENFKFNRTKLWSIIQDCQSAYKLKISPWSPSTFGSQNAGIGNYSYSFGTLGTQYLLYSMALAELVKRNWTSYAMLYTANYSGISRDLIFLSGFQPRYTSLMYHDTFILLRMVKKSYSRVITSYFSKTMAMHPLLPMYYV